MLPSYVSGDHQDRYIFSWGSLCCTTCRFFGENPKKKLGFCQFFFAGVFQNWSGSSMKRRQDAFLLKALRFN